jgi:hypothetical protein
MAISFDCMWCRAKLSVDDSLAGQGMLCPTCNIGLLSDRQNGIMLGSLFAVLGLLCMLSAGRKK